MKCDEQYPKLLRFLSCKVRLVPFLSFFLFFTSRHKLNKKKRSFKIFAKIFSSSCVELVDLLQSVLQSVATTESESKMLKMLQTARNIIDLFISLAPLKHHNEITTLPQMAGKYSFRTHHDIFLWVISTFQLAVSCGYTCC